MGADTQPLGGTPQDLYASPSEAEALKHEASGLPSWDLTASQICDLELLLNGGFFPLVGFQGAADVASILEGMRLASGALWPLPVTLDVSRAFAQALTPDDRIALRDPEGVLLAVMQVEELWSPDAHEQELVRLAGPVQGVEAPTHYDFKDLRATPAQLRQRFSDFGWERVVAYHPSGPLERAAFEAVLRVAAGHGAKLLLHPFVGQAAELDSAHFTRVRRLENLVDGAPASSARLSLLNLLPGQAGSREVLWRAILAKNHGCLHVIVTSETMQDERLVAHAEEIGVGLLPCAALSSGESNDLGVSSSEPPPGQGFTVFFTGLSGSGKSTIANALRVKLLARGGRQVTLLDGDLVRKNLSRELGFSKADRDINIRRIGWVAAEITRHGGIAICAPIAPYAATRRDVRAMIEPLGGFLEVHVATPLAVCEARDRKGLYAKARAGLIKEFTGISDPYEEPQAPELRIDTQDLSADDAAQAILTKLVALGYLTR